VRWAQVFNIERPTQFLSDENSIEAIVSVIFVRAAKQPRFCGSQHRPQGLPQIPCKPPERTATVQQWAPK
jgi:hypothetical protein